MLAVARVAGIQAAKQTPNLLPLCHPLLVGSVFVNFRIEDSHVEVEAQVDTVDRTGVEMEAMTACAVAALTIYDMCKSLDRGDDGRRARPVGEDRRPLGDVPPPAPPRRRRIGHLTGLPGFAHLTCPKRGGLTGRTPVSVRVPAVAPGDPCGVRVHPLPVLRC